MLDANPPTPPLRSRLAEVAAVFLRLGFTAFGGPAAHIALMEDQVVRRRKWITRDQLMEMVAAVNFIPGPNSTELAIHLGWVRAGWRGLLVAGACFIIPAMLIILPVGWLYVNGMLGDVRANPPWLMAIRACIVAIVAAATWRFARTAVVDATTGAIAAISAAAAFVLPRWNVPQVEIVVLLAAGVAGWFAARRTRRPAEATSTGKARALPLLAGALPLAAAAAPVAFTKSAMLALTLFFLKVGATLFGTGYVLVSYLQTGLVQEHRWMSNEQVLDAVAVGQFTPGPLLTTATFIGYVLGNQAGGTTWGIVGATLATAAIFLPSFGFVAALGPVWGRLRASKGAQGALRGMNAAVVALVLAAAVSLGQQAIVNVPTALAAGASLIILILWNINATWLVLGSAAAGLVVGLVR